MRGVHRGEEVAAERPCADHMEGDIRAGGKLIHRNGEVRDGAVRRARAVDAALVRNIDIGHVKTCNLFGAAAEDRVIQLLCHNAVTARRRMQILTRSCKQRAALGIGIGQLIKVDKVILARILCRELARNAFLRGVQYRRCTQIVHCVRSLAIDRIGDIDALGVCLFAEYLTDAAVIGLKPLKCAVRAADGGGIVRAHRDDIDRRVALLRNQRICQHLHIVALGAGEKAGRGDAVVGDDDLFAVHLGESEKLGGISCREAILDRVEIALGNTVADERDAQRLFIGLRPAVDHVKAFCRDARACGIGQRRFFVRSRIRLDLCCVDHRARRKGCACADGHIKAAAQHLRVARLRVVRADESTVEGTARDVDPDIAVRRIVLSVRRGQRGGLGCRCRYIVQSALRKDRRVERTAGDVQRRIIRED